MAEEKRNDEIDLIEVFLNIYIFFKKHFWFLFIALIIGAALGYSTKFFTKEHYESSMLINSYTTSENILIEYFDNIQSIINDGNYKYLSKKMEIDSTKLRALTRISAENAYNEKEKKALGYLHVSVNVLDNNILKSLNNGIIKYLEKEPYVLDEIKSFKENNINIISKIDEEINKIEALQNLNLSQNKSQGEVNIYNDQRSFQNELLDLLKEKQNREKNLEYAAPYRVIQDFTIYQKPIRKTKTYTLMGGILFGFIALFILILRNINISIKEKEIPQ